MRKPSSLASGFSRAATLASVEDSAATLGMLFTKDLYKDQVVMSPTKWHVELDVYCLPRNSTTTSQVPPELEFVRVHDVLEVHNPAMD